MDELQAQWPGASSRVVHEHLRTRSHRVPIRISIPRFPDFKRLAVEDQYEIEQWVKQFEPYSDFNFVSMWSWNTTGDFEVSWVGDNLAVIFNDYSTNQRFLSFIGVDEVDVTARTLLGYARSRGLVEELRL